MDNNKQLISQLLNDDTTLNAFDNECDTELCYKYPEETFSFQGAELQSVLHDTENNSSYSEGKRPCQYPVDSPVNTLVELNSILSTETYSQSCLTRSFSGNGKIYDSSCASIPVEGSTENNFQHNSSYSKKSTYNLRDRSKINNKTTGNAVMHTQINSNRNNSFPSVNYTEISRSLQRKPYQVKRSKSVFETSKMLSETVETSNNSVKDTEFCYKYPEETFSFQGAELQSVLHDTENNSSYSEGKRPCQYPVDSPVNTLVELNSILSTETYSQSCLTRSFSGNGKIYDSSCTSIPVEGSTKNNFQHNSSYSKKSTYNLRDRSKINNKTTGKAGMHIKINSNINNSYPNINHTEGKSCQIKHSQSLYETSKILTETPQVSNNYLKVTENKHTHSLNSTSNMGTLSLRTNLSNNDSVYFHLLDSVCDSTKLNKTDHNFFARDAERINGSHINNISLIPELNFEKFGMVKEDDSSLSPADLVHGSLIRNDDQTIKLFSSSDCNCTSSEDSKTICKNSEIQNGVQSSFRRQSKENEEPNPEVRLFSYVKDNDLSKVTNYISHQENTIETQGIWGKKRYKQYEQQKPRSDSSDRIHVSQSRKQCVKNISAQSRLSYTSADKENIQRFNPCCNNEIANSTIIKMSQNKFKQPINARPSINMTEDLSKASEKEKHTSHVTNTFESEQFIIESKNKTQHTSWILTADNTSYSHPTNIIQNQVNCVHNKTVTINCSQRGNYLDGKEQTIKYCNSSDALIIDTCGASKTEDLNCEDIQFLINEENRIKSRCFKVDSVNHSVMSQTDSFVNEEETVSRQLSFSKTNNITCTKMRKNNVKSSECMYKACYSTKPPEKHNHQKRLAGLRECLFDDSFFDEEVGCSELNIPFSELRGNRSVLVSTENLPTDFAGILNTKNGQKVANIKHINKSKKKPTKHVEWQTQCLRKYIISKLHPVYGIKSHLICENLMQFLLEKIKETVEDDFNFHVCINKIKAELARWNIVKTNMDFYLFVLKYFRSYEQDFVHKSVPCIQTFGRPNLVPRPCKEYMSERILS